MKSIYRTQKIGSIYQIDRFTGLELLIEHIILCIHLD